MSITVAPSQSAIQAALRAFLLGILPAGTEVIATQDNRVPEPAPTNFVTMTTISRTRLETNIDDWADAVFTGSIAGTVMTITGVQTGALAVGRAVFGVLVADGTTVTAFGTGTGGVGTYTVDTPQTVASGTLSAGSKTMTQPTEIAVQLDVHGPASADNAQVISTTFRDEFAVQFFADINPDIAPLYADDPRQMPFINDQNQYETRWVVTAMLQANQTASGFSQQFAGAADLTIVSVEAEYPPS